MRTRRRNCWREYDLDQPVTVTVTMTVQAGVLRVKQQENNGLSCYANLKHGIFLTQEVLDALVDNGVLTPRLKRTKADLAHKSPDFSV
jgi:hypothetical protein